MMFGKEGKLKMLEMKREEEIMLRELLRKLNLTRKYFFGRNKKNDSVVK